LTDYKNLFRGAARLGVMVAAHDVPFTRTTPFVQALSEELDVYQAMRVCSADARLGLATRGEGKGFVHRCARLMDDSGVGQEELRRFLVRASQFDHRKIELRIDLLGEAGGGFAYRLRAPHELDLAKAMLIDGGATAPGLAAVDETARLAGRTGAMAFECHLDLAGGRRESVLLGRCPRQALAEAGETALEGLEGAGDPWLSVGPSGLELTVEQPPSSWAGERGRTLVSVFGKDQPDRGHVRLGPGSIERDVVCVRTGGD
jgi:hypothetical protein